MRFSATPLAGAFVVEPEPVEDERGLFARTWCRREWQARGLNAELAQCSVSFTTRAGTVRGLHYQAAPHAEAKLVRCTRGRIYDVIVAPEWRRRSLGRTLVRLLLDHPAVRGASQVRLGTRDAQRLYAGFGFVPRDQLPPRAYPTTEMVLDRDRAAPADPVPSMMAG